MADDWSPGDLALCVRTCGNRAVRAVGVELLPGSIWTVTDTVRSFCGRTPDVLGLVFEEIKLPPLWEGFAASCFRKIRPHTPDAEDRETIALLNGKPARLPDLEHNTSGNLTKRPADVSHSLHDNLNSPKGQHDHGA